MKVFYNALAQFSPHVRKLIGGFMAIALLLVLAQRLAVDAYWETHPEEYLKAVSQESAFRAMLARVRTLQRLNAEADVAGRAQGIKSTR
jgi:hypothetical protein